MTRTGRLLAASTPELTHEAALEGGPVVCSAHSFEVNTPQTCQFAPRRPSNENRQRVRGFFERTKIRSIPRQNPVNSDARPDIFTFVHLL